MTFLEDWNNGQDTEFQARVAAALLDYVDTEVASFSDTTTDREKRLVRAILISPFQTASVVAPYLAASDNISNVDSDATIRNAISSNKGVLALETFDESDA